MRVWSPAILFVPLAILAGCTTIHGVGGGPSDGEFYVAAQRTYLGIPGKPYVVLCKEIRDPLGVQLDCRRVIDGPDLARLAPNRSVSTTIQRTATKD